MRDCFVAREGTGLCAPDLKTAGGEPTQEPGASQKPRWLRSALLPPSALPSSHLAGVIKPGEPFHRSLKPAACEIMHLFHRSVERHPCSFEVLSSGTSTAFYRAGGCNFFITLLRNGNSGRVLNWFWYVFPCKLSTRTALRPL